MVRTRDVEHHDFACADERDEQARALLVDPQELRHGRYVRDREDIEVEDGRRRSLLCIDEVEGVVDHTRRERAQPLIARNQLDFHRAGRARRVTHNDGPGDGTTREIPDPDAAAQVRRVTAVDMERAQRADEVAGDHEVVHFVDRKPCGLNPSAGGVAGHARTKLRPASYSTTRPGCGAVRAAHERHEKAAVAERCELVGDR